MDYKNDNSSSSDEEPAAKRHRRFSGLKTVSDAFRAEMESFWVALDKKPAEKKKKLEKKKQAETKSNCVICLNGLCFPKAQPSACQHQFHPNCLSTWAETSNTCPIDRSKFHSIKVSGSSGQEIFTREVITPPILEDEEIIEEEEENIEEEEEIIDNLETCPICLSSGEKDDMVYCFECCAGYHKNCLQSPQIQVEYWTCMSCVQEGEEDGRCRICLSTDFEEGTAHCSKCRGAYHIRCIEPPSLPDQNWICSLCKEANR